MNFINRDIVFYTRSRSWKKCDRNAIQYPLNYEQVMFSIDIRNTNDVYKRANDWYAGRNFSDLFFAYKDSKSRTLIFEEDSEYFNVYNRMLKREFIKIREYDVLFGLALIILIPGEVFNEPYTPEIGTIRFFTGYDFVEKDQFFRWEWVGKNEFNTDFIDYTNSFFYISERHKPDVYGNLHSPVSSIYEEYNDYLFFSTITKKLEYRKIEPIYIIENGLPKDIEQNKILQDREGTKIKTTHSLDQRCPLIQNGLRDANHERSMFFTDSSHNDDNVLTREADFVYYKVKREFKPYEIDKNVAELNPLQKVKTIHPPPERIDSSSIRMELDRKLSSLLSFPSFGQSDVDKRSKATMTAFMISASTVIGINKDISEYCDFAKIMFINCFGNMIKGIHDIMKTKLTDLKKDVLSGKETNMFFLSREDFNNGDEKDKFSKKIDQLIDQEYIDLSKIVINLRIKPFVITPDTEIINELYHNQLIDKLTYFKFLSSIIGIASNEFLDDKELKDTYYENEDENENENENENSEIKKKEEKKEQEKTEKRIEQKIEKKIGKKIEKKMKLNQNKNKIEKKRKMGN
jgi:hypothetical protein